MKSFMKNALALLLALLLISSVTICASAEDDPGDPADDDTIVVAESEIAYWGFSWAVQDALDLAQQRATDDAPITVVVPAGSYDQSFAMRIFSNTTLDLRGVTILRSGQGNMLRVGSEETENTGVTGYAYRNIHLIGGTFDGNMGENTIIKAFHTKGFTMDGVTLKNENDGHMTEFAGVDGLTVRDCVFHNQQLAKGKYGYEAIQLDVLHPFHITNGRCEDLPVNNVLIERCRFSEMPRGVGSHTAVHNCPHNNITIRNNTFTDMKSIAIQGLNWTNVSIYSNVIQNAPRGVTVYAEPGGSTYLSSKLAAKGSTQSHVSDAYQTPGKANIEIRENVLKSIGTTDDIYASYSSQGIAVLGEKLTATSAVNSTDESGGLPAGDYYLDGVKIHANYIDVRGNGVRVEDARTVSVTSNEILCNKNTVHSDNYYGIVLRSNVTASTVSYNTIKNAEVNGIQIDGTKGGSVSTMQYNRIENCGKYGVGAYTMKFTNIYNNDIITTKNNGFHLAESCTASEMKWNRVRKSEKSGIWITSNSKVTLVQENTTVNCTNNNSFGGSTTVKSNYTASKALTSFSLPWYKTTRKGAKMGVNRMFKLIPDVRPVNAFANFTYKSSNANIVKVDANGMVYGVKEGKATITVTSDNGISMQYPITVIGEIIPSRTLPC